MNQLRSLFVLLMVLVLGGCATLPTGPSVMVLPTPGKPFDVFQSEDASCRYYASQQVGMSPQATVNQNTVANAALGTVLGAGLGAAIGSISGNAGTGAAVGAGSGLLGGTLAGSSTGQVYGYEAQRRYDIAYQQCMYANGNQVPGAGQSNSRTYSMPPPPPPPPPSTSVW